MEENTLNEAQLDDLQWAVDFMEKYEKKMANRRRVERIKMEDDGR